MQVEPGGGIVEQEAADLFDTRRLGSGLSRYRLAITNRTGPLKQASGGKALRPNAAERGDSRERLPATNGLGRVTGAVHALPHFERAEDGAPPEAWRLPDPQRSPDALACYVRCERRACVRRSVVYGARGRLLASGPKQHTHSLQKRLGVVRQDLQL